MVEELRDSVMVRVREDGLIVNGHTRLFALAANGERDVPVEVVDDAGAVKRVESRAIADLVWRQRGCSDCPPGGTLS